MDADKIDSGEAANHPSNDLALEEARRSYDQEHYRRQAIDAKASGLLAVDAILLSLVYFGSESGPIFNLAYLSLLSVSVALALFVLRARGYTFPVVDMNFHYMYSQGEKSIAEVDYLKEYLASIPENASLNDKRYSKLQWAFRSTILVTVLFIGESFIQAIDAISFCR